MNQMKAFVLWALAVVACWAMLASCTIMVIDDEEVTVPMSILGIVSVDLIKEK
jgi:hypothetical protein